jgi:serine/threonine protein kinase
VALKIMSEEIQRYPRAMEMFLQEAKALAALNHPNVVTVFDQGQDGGQMFIVMEFIEGTTLEEYLARHRRLKVQQAAAIVDQLCAGLAYAHERRIIHRDIKPANVFLSREGVAKLGDFGLARIVEEARIHRTEVRGTPLYMAPEQIRGSDIDFRADLYSVGCTFFEMLTGQPPFVEGEVLYHHLHTAPPRPSQFNAELAPAVDELVLSCIAKDQAQRIASANHLRVALRKLRQQGVL